MIILILVGRLAYTMSVSTEKFEEKHKQNTFQNIRPGDTIRVYQRVTEGGEERLQPFEGLVIARDGGESLDATITIRGEVSDGYFMERIYPIHSPVVEKAELIKRSKTNRSKLYYMRERTGRKAKMKRIDVDEEEEIGGERKKDQEEKQEPEEESQTSDQKLEAEKPDNQQEKGSQEE